MRGVVEAPRNPADLAVPDQASEGHADTARIALIGEIMGREGPAAPLRRHQREDSLVE